MPFSYIHPDTSLISVIFFEFDLRTPIILANGVP